MGWYDIWGNYQEDDIKAGIRNNTINIYSISIKETLIIKGIVTYQVKPIENFLIQTGSENELDKYSLDFIQDYLNDNKKSCDNRDPTNLISEVELTVNHNKGFTIYKRFFGGYETLVITQDGFKSYFHTYR